MNNGILTTINKKIWEDIDTVFLDMDGTLLDLHFDNYFWQVLLPQAYSEKHGRANDQTNFTELAGLLKEEAGTLNWYCIDFWQDTLDIDIMALKQTCAHLIQFRPGVEDFLKSLQEKNINTVLVTNAHRKSLNLKLKICPLDTLMTQLFSSHDFGLAKEHNDFWATFNKTYSFDKNRSIFIDDNEKVLEAAKKYGFKHLFSILQPDSHMSKANDSAFYQIEKFQDILPSR